MTVKLTIGIPTYNRKLRLLTQLESIFKQNLANVEEIIIVDNCSNYDVGALVSEFKSNKIRLVHNPFNLKSATNILSPFLYCKTEWMWLLSDDDETVENSISEIINSIESADETTGMIKFAIDGRYPVQREAIANSLEEYIDYYYEDKPIRSGEAVFMSTNVYNINILKNYLSYAFEYSYTQIGFLIPVIKGLNDREISVVFSNKSIVKYTQDTENPWDMGAVGKGLATLPHLPLKLSAGYKKKLFNCLMPLSLGVLVKGYLANKGFTSLDDISVIYNGLYKHCTPYKSRLSYYVFVFSMRNKMLKRAVFLMVRFAMKFR